MAYNDLLVLAGIGTTIRIDVSFDDFSTITHRWGTKGGYLDGANAYDSRIQNIGSISRGFGDGGIAGAGIFDITLDSTDGDIDWLLDISEPNFYNITKARFRVYSVIYKPSSPNATSKQLGDFYIVDFPHRNTNSIRMQLGDAVLGALDQPISLPTLGDWLNNPGEDEDTCPFFNSTGEQNYFSDGVSLDTQIPVAFGSDPVRIIPIGRPTASTSVTSSFFAKGVAVVCVTANLDAVDTDNITALRVRGKKSKLTMWIPREATFIGGTSPTTIWEPMKSRTITKGDIDYKILYIKYANLGAFVKQRSTFMQADYDNESDQSRSNDPALWSVDIGNLLDADNLEFYVEGTPLSAVTYPSNSQHGADALYDLITYYAPGDLGANVNTASFAAVKSATFTGSSIAGVAGGFWEEQGVFGYTLREIISRLCASCDFDFYINWAGQPSLSTEMYNFDTFESVAGSSLEQVTEPFADIVDWIPTSGERGAVFNRIRKNGGHGARGFSDFIPEYPAPWPGPFDDAVGIGAYGRPLERRLEISWLPMLVAQSPSPFATRNIRNLPRTRVRFITDISGLKLDLGDLFYLTWTRNRSSPYVSTIFRVESISFNNSDNSVEIEALWNDNVAGEKPYLLDNESFLIKATGSGGRTATVENGLTTVEFSSGSLVSDGIAPGDVLVLMDVNQAESTAFTRYRSIKIDTIDDDTHLSLGGADLSFDAASPVAVAEWEIRRSYLTYPTAITDATNYPANGEMYGKVCSNADEYTDAEDANLLLNG